MQSKQTAVLDWTNILFLSLSPLLAMAGIYYHYQFEATSGYLYLYAIILYVLSGIAITAGYHRLFAHRSYQARFGLKLYYLIMGAGALQNSALKWCADHRVHHKDVDKETDPYNINKGFWYAHITWIFYKDQQNNAAKEIAKDLNQDALVLWQNKYYLSIASLTAFILPLILGILHDAPVGGLAIAGFLRIVVVHHCTFFINSLAHTWGTQTYTDKNSAKDNFILALFTYGEGYHNFHHLFQSDYRNGLRWYHFDPTKWWIKTMSYWNQAYQLHKVSEHSILKAKMQMDMKRLQEKMQKPDYQQLQQQYENYLLQLKEKVEKTQAKFYQLKLDYANYKKQKDQNRVQKLKELKLELENARLEFKKSYEQWQLYTRSLTQMT